MADPIEIITAPELIAYPGSGSPSVPDATFYAEQVNGLVTEAWKNAEEPVPYWVRGIALEVAGRASRNPKGLTSWTRSADEGSRTERVSEAQLERVGIYLTDEERARLGGKKVRQSRYGTIRIGSY